MNESEKDKLLREIAEQFPGIAIADLTKLEKNIARKLSDKGIQTKVNKE